MKFSRRTAMEILGAGALAPAAALPAGAAQIPAPPKEGRDTPKIVLGMEAGRVPGPVAPGSQPGVVPQTAKLEPRRVKQLGVDHVLSGGPPAPWTEQSLKALMEPWEKEVINVSNLMINLTPDIIYGKPGNKRDKDIEDIKQSIIVAGKVGLPVVEYNFYAHRFMEGYFEELDAGRANSAWTGLDYERVSDGVSQYQRPEDKGKKVRDLPPLPEEGAHTLDQMWANITYFLKAVIPTAEKANVRLALHPNDPPVPVSRGSQQIMATLAGWKKLITIVNSPSNGITFDCGVTREMGEDPVEVARYFGSRDRINHVHFRNVLVTKPYERYTEVWIDEGLNNMFAVMKELVKNRYTRLIYPEHPRRLDYDAERGVMSNYPGGGGYAAFAFNVGYTRAMIQAAMS